MEEADLKLLYLLDLNSRTPVGKLAALSGMSAEKCGARLSALIDKGVVRRCYPEIDRSKLGYYVFKLYFQFQNVNPQMLEEIFGYLSAYPNAGWVVSCSGRWDMIMAVWTKNIDEFSQTYESILSKCNKFILGKVVSITVEFFLSNKKWLWDEGQESDVVRVGCVPSCITDDEDFRVLRFLGGNGRAPIATIADGLRMEPADVERRIKDMQKKGVILSFRTDLDLAALGRTFCKSFVYLTRCSREEEEKLLQYCFRHPEISAIIRCVGPWDLEIEAHCKSFQHFTELMNDMRNRYPEVVRNFEAVVITKETGMMFTPRDKQAPRISAPLKEPGA
ncbi:Lrp/AsnC family transcriptional regulator [Candidatus Micrarchaeota archaeon]|nr:Lrp/AsnC family transcriptional regulator [Candidatus Micrarchaeota archaeon]